VVLTLDDPGVAENDIVQVRSRFFRRYAYESRALEARMAAVLVGRGRDVTRLVPGEDPLTPTLMRGVAWMVGALATLLALGVWREPRLARAGREARVTRRRRRRAAGPPAAADAAPEDGSGPAAADAADGPVPGTSP